MLRRLSIQNFTLIADATVCFKPNFTAITGETGSGKSVLLKALRAVCGEKTPPSVIRTGNEKATIEAEFEIKGNKEVLSILNNLEIDADDDLILHRDILQNGKGRARANGVLITLSDLQKLGEALLQMHGQSEQLLLRDPSTHIQLLDDYACNENLLSEYKKKYSEWVTIKQQIATAKTNAEKLAAEKDFLKFQADELENAALKEGEEAALQEKIDIASKGELEENLLSDISKILERENGLFDNMHSLDAKIKTLAAKVPGYESWLEQIQEASISLESILKDFSRLSPKAKLQAFDINKANARLAKIQKLKRKYKTDESGLIALYEKRKQELNSLENADADIEELLKAEVKKLAELTLQGNTLSNRRKEVAQKLDIAVENELHALGMDKAKFKTSVQDISPAPNGLNKVEFLMTPNKGEGEQSLQKAVSGGELSRVLLAFKTVTANTDKVPLLIFDEVDSGISGEIGNKIGEALRKLGESHQVFTITHLHQVAARAENQIAVTKEEIDSRTFTKIHTLDYEARLTEIVRMLGESSFEEAKEHAKKLLEKNDEHP